MRRKAPRFLAALLAAGLITTSCNTDSRLAGPTPPAVSQDLAASLGNGLDGVTRLLGTLLTCRPLPFDSDSALIGPAGGTLHLGPHTFTIPRGALDRPVWVKGEAPSDTVNSVRFRPEGLQFERSASLTLSYANCSLVGGLLTPKRVAYTTDGLRILNFVPSVDNILSRTVTGKIDHFSRYAASY